MKLIFDFVQVTTAVQNKSGYYPVDYARKNKTLWQKLFDNQAEKVTEKFPVDPAHVKYVVGQQQKNIEDIRAITGTLVNVPRDAASNPVEIVLTAIRQSDIDAVCAFFTKRQRKLCFFFQLSWILFDISSFLFVSLIFLVFSLSYFSFRPNFEFKRL